MSFEMSAFAFASLDVSDGGDLVLRALGTGAAFFIMFNAWSTRLSVSMQRHLLAAYVVMYARDSMPFITGDR